MRIKNSLIGAAGFVLILCDALVANADPVLFLSTQLTPIPEARMMRQVILKGFTRPVDFEPYDRPVYNAQVLDIAANPKGAVVLGGVQEDFIRLYRAGVLQNVNAIWSRLPSQFVPQFSGRAVFSAGGMYFIPWMQATYLMAASKRALKYLPSGTDLNRLSYDDLREWAANMNQATGKGMLGFPVGPKGLMPRFLEGYLYPSFTGSMTEGFASPEAIAMWRYLQGLWRFVTPASLISNRMDEALLHGKVWVAWDHSARLLEVFKERPGEFVAFPAPSGPKGRGFISVLAGLGLPRGISSVDAEKLIDYLTSPEVQVLTMESVGFLPTVEIGNLAGRSGEMQTVLQAATEQLNARDGILTSVPLLGEDVGRGFDLAYMVAFSKIVLRGMDVRTVLQPLGMTLQDMDGKDQPTVPESRGH
jgi:multiple sugar transport system substrate-binding protein